MSEQLTKNKEKDNSRNNSKTKNHSVKSTKNNSINTNVSKSNESNNITNNSDKNMIKNSSRKEQELKEINKDRVKSNKSKKGNKDNMSNYESDSSDEDVLVRTGNVPREWYKGFDHLGYAIDSKKVQKPEEEDEVEKFLQKAKSKDWWRNITDEMNNKTVYLSDKDLEIINRIRSGRYASSKVKDDDEFFERNLPYQIYPLSNHQAPRKAFEPSKNERKMVNHLARLIEDGVIQITKEKKPHDFFEEIADVWKFENTNTPCYHPGNGFSMPKPDAPDNDQSYNFNNEGEISLRRVSRYEKLVEEQYERLLDIFQSARVIKKKQDISEKDILPEVPDPKDLKPFPTKDNIIHKSHGTSINTLCVESSGDYVFSGDIGGFVYFSDIMTSKVLLEVNIDDKIKSIQYNSFLSLVAVCCDGGVYFLRPKFLRRKNETPELLEEKIIPLVAEKAKEDNDSTEKNEKENYYWKIHDDKKSKRNGLLFSLHKKTGNFISLNWHCKGDFFSVLGKSELGKTHVNIFNLSSLQYFSPSNKNKGEIRSVSFHPTKPQFYVCSESNVLIYDLKQQELIRKFVSNLNPIISICLHPLGTDFVAGSLGGKVAWFQADLSEKPYLQMDQYHEGKIKSLVFHNKYNLLSSASKEGKVLLYYSKVYDDILKDPLIVPLTTLKSVYNYKAGDINSTGFHPNYPWILTCGSNKLISVWS